jgi:Mrp family chromosome partitioning ATPase
VGAKGGTGTSLLTAALALKAVQAGRQVGILDAHIASPDISPAFATDQPMTSKDDLFQPKISRNGIRIISYADFMTDPTEAMLWDQGMMAGVVEQFWTAVNWGRLDLLLIDCPSGGGDIPLLLSKIVPIDAMLLVSTAEPHTLVRAEQTRNMLDWMRLPVHALLANRGRTAGPAGSLQTAVVRMGLPEPVMIDEELALQAAYQAGELADFVIGNRLEPLWLSVEEILQNKQRKCAQVKESNP